MFQKRFAVPVAALVLLSAWADAATVDPLLRGLQQKSSGGIWYERLIALETDARSGETRIGVILDLDGALPDLAAIDGLVVGSVVSDIATACLPLSSLNDLAAVPGIAHITAARIWRPLLDMAVPAAHVDDVWNGAPAYTGAGVLVGVIDSGIDWRHDDFRHANGTTRIKAIWDLWGSGSAPPTGFGYGAEWDENEINASLTGGGSVNEEDTNGHGTHVSGIAFGNGRASSGQYTGVAPEADILFAKPFHDDVFSENKTIDAMNYLVQKAQALGQPITINMSLGGHFGAHDGTSAQERVIDDLSGPGVVFCVAAGNEGESYLAETGPASGHDYTLRVLPYTPTPGGSNDVWAIILWYEGSASTAVRFSVPGLTDAWVQSGQTRSVSTDYGHVLVDNASGGADPANGDKMCLIQVDDRDNNDVAAIDWTISVDNGTGTAHAWVVGSSMFVGFPNSDQSYSVGMPGCAESAVSVAAWKTRNTWPGTGGTYGYAGDWGTALIGARAPFSSQGPTRDGRQKPDITAPGMAVVSCYSQDQDPPAADALRVPGNDYWVTQGTSMATPFVCGVVGLMLEKNPDLTADNVRSILRTTASHDEFTGFGWTRGFGAGKIDAAAALAAVTGVSVPDGDIDADEATTVLDVILLVNHIVDPGAHPLTVEQREAADVFPAGGGDGTLNISDVTRIVAFILGTATPARVVPDVPATFAVGDAYLEDGVWWMPVTLAGEAVAGGQFALTLEGAGWRPDDVKIDGDAGTAVAASVVGDQIRILVYDLDNGLPAAGVTVRVPYAAVAAGEPAVTGLLVTDPQGYARTVEITRGAGVLPPVRFVRVAPNPTRDDATVAFQLGRGQDVRVVVYDLKGRRVRAFVLGQLGAGAHAVGWDGRDASGHDVAAGVYLVRLTTPEQVETRKVVVAR
jgi:subtilisin family serine protease